MPDEATAADALFIILAIQFGRCPRYNHRVKSASGQESLPQVCYLLETRTSGEPMADESKKDTVTLQELTVSTLAMTDAAVKLLIKKGIFTDEEFKNQLGTERANYLAVLKRLH